MNEASSFCNPIILSKNSLKYHFHIFYVPDSVASSTIYWMDGWLAYQQTVKRE